MKAVAFESKPEINGFVEKLVIFFSDQFALLAINRIIYNDKQSSFNELLEKYSSAFIH